MFQQITLIGNLGKDPEMKYLPDGTAVTNLSVAASTYIKSKGDHTTWFRVSVWGKQAESAHQYLHKGSRVLVIGPIVSDDSGNPRLWTGNDGSNRASFEVKAEILKFLSPKGEFVESGAAAASQDDDDDLSF